MICVVIQGPCRPSSMSLAGSRFVGSRFAACWLARKVLKKSFTCSGRYPIMNSRAEAQPIGAVSSGVEHYLDTVGVTSSNLVSPTKNDKTEEVFLLGLFVIESPCRQCRSGHGPVPHPDSDRVAAKTQHLGLMKGCAVHLHAYGLVMEHFIFTFSSAARKAAGGACACPRAV